MAKAQSSNPNKDHPAFHGPRNQARWTPAITCFILATFMTVAMIDYVPAQYTGNIAGAATVVENGHLVVKSIKSTEENLVGSFGVYTTYYSYSIVGGAAWLIPIYLFWLTFLALRSSRRFAGTRIMVMCFSVLALAGLWEMQDWFLGNKQWFPHGPGGVLGNLVYREILRSIFGVFGACTLLLLFYGLSVMFIFTKDIGTEFDKIAVAFQEWKARRAARKAQRAEERRLLREKEARERMAASMHKPGDGVFPVSPVKPALVIKKDTATEKATGKPTDKKAEGNTPAKDTIPSLAAEAAAAEKKTAKDKVTALREDSSPPPPTSPMPATAPANEKTAAKPAEEKTPAEKSTDKARADAPAPTAIDTKDLAVGALGKIELNIVKPEETKKARTPLPLSTDSNYQFPPLTLLKEQAKPAPENSEE